jgi:prophage regulatory protein
VHKFDELKIITKPFLSVEELASYIGVKVSYIYKMTHNREIPHYKPGGKMIYFDRKEIDECVLSQRVATADEIRSEARRRIRKSQS